MATGSVKQSAASDWGDVTGWLSNTERGSCSRAYFENVLNVSFMTVSRVHAEDDVIMTLPEAWRPSYAIDFPAYYRNGCCVLRITTDGVMKIWLINDTTNAGRIYGNFTLIKP